LISPVVEYPSAFQVPAFCGGVMLSAFEAMTMMGCLIVYCE
jgi:hypothetical protein